MGLPAFLISILVSVTSLIITEPVDGETYDGDWLMLNSIVENDDEIPDSVRYVLNGQAPVLLPRLNTDWYTYMQNDVHHGFSESPAPMDNTILWAAPVTGDYHEFPTPVIVDGLVYYPSNYGKDSLFALDAATGETVWKYYTGYTDDAVTVKDGYVYTASDSLWCFDALTGDRVWATAAADADGSTPAVYDGGVFCGRGSFSPTESHVYRFDALTGDEEWSQTFPGYTASCLTVWNGMVFIPTYYGALNALDAGTGSIIWQNTDSYGGYWDSSPVILDGIIYICGSDAKARAINALTGTTVWEVDITPGTYISATPAYHDGRLYFADQVDTYHCLDADDGSTVWSVPGVHHGSSGLADGVVFYGEGSNYYDATARVMAIDWDNGQTIWSYMTTSGPYGIVSCPAITDGVMYIAATDWNLYAFGTGLRYTYREDCFYADVGPNELIVTSFDGGSAVAADTINFTVTQEGISLQPSTRLALQAAPNPFHSSASVSFQLSESGRTSVAIYDLSGRIVRTLQDSELSEGRHSVQWDGTDDHGRTVSAGIYICRIQSGGIAETTGLCLLR
ncbi:MAG: PQQ-binding-like beta-propeller repeat protein [Candidatus Fermentibacteraceae bacterium]|nr:PQQ-binding-like beta-propeller repeat protein [Candidatus Fermentibacteraceae bacterium]MBN2608914.1 PQQ-binding-like beta-propeller repeat protein [Candidatus Fermentibacteraceae bacterium]